MTVVFVVGSTATGRIEGISAAGATPDLLAHTPTADAEIVAYGRPVGDSPTPVSPTGCPTPAVVTRAVREETGFDLVTVDAGTATQTAAPTVTVGSRPGDDVREPIAVSDAASRHERGRELGSQLPADELVVGESIPGGTTTALGVFRALGEPYGVSSSLSTNPLQRKEDVVATGLAASGLAEGDAAGEPIRAIRTMGDPVLAATSGIVCGALATGTDVTLAGGTQLLAVAALVRHAGVDAPLELATTSFLAADETVDLDRPCRDLDISLTVTDPGFDRGDHVTFERYRRGEAKEGACMGGALALADRDGVPMARIRDRTVTCVERVSDDGS